MSERTCDHCRGARYVLAYSLERRLRREGLHLTDLPRPVFEQIPLSLFSRCHCNPALLFQTSGEDVYCRGCLDTTWRFTEFAESEGYYDRKAGLLTAGEILTLPCYFFERCPCGAEDRFPGSRKRRPLLQDILHLLQTPQPSLSLRGGLHS